MDDDNRKPTKRPFYYVRLITRLGKPKRNIFIFFAVLSIFMTGFNLLAQNIPRLIIDGLASVKTETVSYDESALLDGTETITHRNNRIIIVRNAKGTIDYTQFFMYASLYFIFMGLYVLGRVLTRLNVEKASIDIVSNLKIRMFSHLTKVKLDFFHKNPVGRLLTRIESDVEGLRLVFEFLMVTIFGDLFQSLTALTFMFVFNFKLAVWLMIPVGMLIIFSILYQKYARPRIVKLRKKISEITGYIAESISGVRTIQAFKNEVDFKNRFSKEVEERRIRTIKIFFVMLVYFRSAGLFERLSKWIIIFIFGLLTTSYTDASIGTLVMFTTLVTIAIMPIRMISERFGQIQQALASLERVDDIMRLKREDDKDLYTLVKDERNLIEEDRKIQKTITNTKTLKKGIEFDNVWFYYDERLYEEGRNTTKDDPLETDKESKEKQWVLKGVSFFLPAGQSLAIIGATGCGKTTIIKLLFRFYEPQNGRILIDGKDIKEYTLSELRAYMGFVQQENHLFPGTIRDNITLDNPEISMDRIEEGSRLVGSDELISKRENSYDSEVTEKGMNFSSGEKQLIAFTRCLVYERPVLILDEATSNIDANSERLIQKTILNMLDSNKTSIMIAHRLSTIRHCNNIVVMDSGRIIEQGSHDELIELDGKYKQYFKYQLSESVGY